MLPKRDLLWMLMLPKQVPLQIYVQETQHEPSILPDYGGDLFRHRRALICQLDIRDDENRLIPPNKWYDELRGVRQGSLVLMAVTMHGYVQRDSEQKPRKVRKYLKSFVLHILTSQTSKTWQLLAKSIKVIDKSDEAIDPRYQPILPTTEKHKSSPSVTRFAVQKRMRLGK